jgi:hypothetical protein
VGDNSYNLLSFTIGLGLQLLLGDLLRRLWRLIDQGRGLVVLIALSDKGKPSAGHSEEGTFALGIGGLLSKPNALGCVRPVFSGIWHRAP